MPLSLLSKILQEEEICVVRAIELIFKTKQSLDKLKATAFEDLPTVILVLNRIEHEKIDQ